MRENLDEIVRNMSAAWHLIDLDDVEVFEDIRRQCVRMEIEFESSLARRMPFEVEQELGPPSYLKPEWLTVLKAKQQRMMARRARLVGLKTDQDTG